MTRTKLYSLIASIAIGLSGCGGGSSKEPPGPPPPPPPPPMSKAEAFQFLNQTTLGATEAEAQRLIAMRYEAWIDDQLRQPASLQLPFLQALPPPQFMFQLQDVIV